MTQADPLYQMMRDDMDRRFEEVKLVVRESMTRVEAKLDETTAELRKAHLDHESRLRRLEEWYARETGSNDLIKFVGGPFLAALAAALVALFISYFTH